MKFNFELTAGLLLRKDVRNMLNNEKDKLEFNFEDCKVLITENKGFFESHFTFVCKGLPDHMESNVRKWFDSLRELEC